MILQLEDVVDCLDALYADTYEFYFIFDHSSGHAKLRPDGLNVSRMNKYYGGNKTQMRNTTIKNSTYLGPFIHDNKLQVGDVQSMNFQNNDEGPFYLTKEEKLMKKFDREIGPEINKPKSKHTLMNEIRDRSGEYQNIRRTLSQIQSLAKSMGIPLGIVSQKKSVGWMGKSKGMMQILSERGFLDPKISPNDLLKKYTVEGKKGEDGEIVSGTLIKN